MCVSLHECSLSMSVSIYSHMYVCTYVTITNNKTATIHTLNPVYSEHNILRQTQRTEQTLNKERFQTVAKETITTP